jgi:hypothetical protein
VAEPTLTGKANFGFVSKYQKGQSTPDGNTEFQFKAGDLNLHMARAEAALRRSLIRLKVAERARTRRERPR